MRLSGHATAFPVILTGRGNSPAFIILYIVVRPRPSVLPLPGGEGAFLPFQPHAATWRDFTHAWISSAFQPTARTPSLIRFGNFPACSKALMLDLLSLVMASTSGKRRITGIYAPSQFAADKLLDADDILSRDRANQRSDSLITRPLSLTEGRISIWWTAGTRCNTRLFTIGL